MLKEGKKTRLKPFGREHFRKWIEWQGDLDNLDFFRNFNFPLSIDEMEEYYRGLILGRFDKKFFVIYTSKGEMPIGMIHLVDINWQARKVELGILIEREYRGKGHAFDALVVICEYIFNRLNLNKAYVKVMESNERLIRFCKKGGFEIEGVLKEEAFQDGVFYNQVYLALFQRKYRDMYRDYFKDTGRSLKKVVKGLKSKKG